MQSLAATHTYSCSPLLPLACRANAFMQLLELGRKCSAAADAAPAVSDKQLARKMIAAVAGAPDRGALGAQIIERLTAQPAALQWLLSVNGHMHQEMRDLPVATWAHEVPSELTHNGIEKFLRSEEREATFNDFYGQPKARRRAPFTCGRGGEAYSNKSKKEFESADGSLKAVVSGIGDNARVTVTKLKKVVVRSSADRHKPAPPTRNDMLWVKIGFKRAFPDGLPAEAHTAAENAGAAGNIVEERAPLAENDGNIPDSRAGPAGQSAGKHAGKHALAKTEDTAPPSKAAKPAAGIDLCAA